MVDTTRAVRTELSTVRYGATHKPAWDRFVAESKNGVFLFYREYMDYHSSRFHDHSLLFFRGDRLVALLPANLNGNALVSHGGLTFGGVICGERMGMPLMLDIFETLVGELRRLGISQVIYKAVPHIYHSAPAEEDLYALFAHGAQLFRRDVSSTIDMRQAPRLSKGRRWGIKHAAKHGLTVRESHDFRTFMRIEEHVLVTRHNVRPVHTAEELELLAKRFPNNIHLFTAHRGDETLAGVVMYEGHNVAHAQYISASDEGKQTGALDMIIGYLLAERYRDAKYFDFGISTENGGRYLNVGLVENKEGFGARTTVYDCYRLDIT